MNPNNKITQGLPQFPVSLWRDTTDLPSFSPLTEDIHTDVAIVGGGITGITTAYLLSKAGYKVTLLEAGEILSGTTGFTSANLCTAWSDLPSSFKAFWGRECPPLLSIEQ